MQYSAVNIPGNKKKGTNPVPQSFIKTHTAFHNSQLCGLSTDS